MQQSRGGWVQLHMIDTHQNGFWHPLQGTKHPSPSTGNLKGRQPHKNAKTLPGLLTNQCVSFSGQEEGKPPPMPQDPQAQLLPICEGT